MVVLDEDRIEFERTRLEYQEANALFRRYFETSWIVETIFFSVAFAIFGLSWKVGDLALLIILAVTSTGLAIFCFLTWMSHAFYMDIILKRIWELEKQLGLNLYLLIRCKDEEKALKSPVLHSLNKLKYLTIILQVFLVLLWVFRIFLV
jgi:hypothetical protein